MSNVRNYIENDKELEIFTISNFLNDDECNYLCNIINSNHTRSLVAGEGNQASTYLESRTSSTSNLSFNDNIVNEINNRIHNELNIPLNHGEPIQGQLYEIGQEFKHHYDYFWGDGFTNHCLSSGQRTYTCMIYLNDVEEGGETEFWHLNQKRFVPIKGTAVIWKNSDGTGNEKESSLHAGLPVIKGKKIIITKWFRENEFRSDLDYELAKDYFLKQI
jgi:prolyl 4-hydroxylase